MKLEQLEKQRRQYGAAFIASSLLALLVAIGGASGAVRLFGLIWDGGLFQTLLNLIPMILGAATGFLLVQTVGWNFFLSPGFERIQTQFRTLVLENAYGELFSDLVYQPEAGLSRKLIERTNILRRANSYDSAECFSGTYRGRSFRQAQVAVGYFRPGDLRHSAQSELWFSGRWMIYELLPHEIPTLYIYLRSKKQPLSPVPDERYYETQPEAEKVELSDSGFNAEFDVFASDPADALRLLSPAFIRLVRHLQEEVGGTLLLCLMGRSLHIAVDGFETAVDVPLFAPLKPEDAQKAVTAQVLVFTSFLDSLLSGSSEEAPTPNPQKPRERMTP